MTGLSGQEIAIAFFHLPIQSLARPLLVDGCQVKPIRLGRVGQGYI